MAETTRLYLRPIDVRGVHVGGTLAAASDGHFVRGDDADIDWTDNSCPTCGAIGSEECRVFVGGAYEGNVGGWVHEGRQGGDSDEAEGDNDR
jgi:hypothetical protein